MKRIYPVIILTALTIISLAANSCSSKTQYHRIEGFAQGGTFHIIFQGTDPASISAKISETLREIDFSLSGYNKNSLLSRLNAGEDLPLDSCFIELFELSRKIYDLTEGYFDITGAPLFDFWGFGFKNPDRIPALKDDGETSRTIDSLLTFVGMDKVRIDNGRLIKEHPGIKLNFNAIAQGYTCDRIARILEESGSENYLIEVGMEILCRGKNAKGREWRIGIDSPIDGSQEAGAHIEKIIDTTDCGVVTSGNYRKYYILDGKKYAHSIDPHTGYPVQHTLLSATIIAPDAATADALATFCMAAGPETAENFLLSHPEIKGYLITSDSVIDLL